MRVAAAPFVTFSSQWFSQFSKKIVRGLSPSHRSWHDAIFTLFKFYSSCPHQQMSPVIGGFRFTPRKSFFNSLFTFGDCKALHSNLDPTDSNFIGFLKSVSPHYIEREAIGEKFYVSVRYKDYQLQWREEGHNMAVNNIYITGDDWMGSHGECYCLYGRGAFKIIVSPAHTKQSMMWQQQPCLSVLNECVCC